MEITLPGVDPEGNHITRGRKVAFTFVHRGQAAVRMRVSYDIGKPPIVHPLSGGGQPKPRMIDPGRYIVLVEVDAMDLPGLPGKTIDSDLLINGERVLRAEGRIAEDAQVDRDGALFRLVVVD